MTVGPNVCKYLILYKVMNSDVSYEVSYHGKCENKNDEKMNRNSELKKQNLTYI